MIEIKAPAAVSPHHRSFRCFHHLFLPFSLALGVGGGRGVPQRLVQDGGVDADAAADAARRRRRLRLRGRAPGDRRRREGGADEGGRRTLGPV